WLGVRDGSRWSKSAAAPDVTAVENEVPEPMKYEVPMRDPGYAVSIFELGARRLMTERPEATRSGLARPFDAVGPWPEKPAITSSDRLAVPMSSTAPT